MKFILRFFSELTIMIEIGKAYTRLELIIDIIHSAATYPYVQAPGIYEVRHELIMNQINIKVYSRVSDKD